MLVAIPVRINDSRRFETKPVANGAVVVANVLLFVLFQTAGWSLAPGGQWWSIVSYAFAHASPWHLIGNMYVLLLVGNAVNRRVGNFYEQLAVFGEAANRRPVSNQRGHRGRAFNMQDVVVSV